ncbi:MAG: LAGLIDADG family homing endonuclease, partial [Patescibacteria group bacterium]|nr:LAGLIDADG family homing endonuclease [Patescibacteria group bacterium]
SNRLENILGWKAGKGSKYEQKVCASAWIFNKKHFIRNCLRGLIETDGSIFRDRTYTHVNFTSIIPTLVLDVERMLAGLGYSYSTQCVQDRNPRSKPKYVVRVCTRSLDLIKELNINKS